MALLVNVIACLALGSLVESADVEIPLAELEKSLKEGGDTFSSKVGGKAVTFKILSVALKRDSHTDEVLSKVALVNVEMSPSEGGFGYAFSMAKDSKNGYRKLGVRPGFVYSRVFTENEQQAVADLLIKKANGK